MSQKRNYGHISTIIKELIGENFSILLYHDPISNHVLCAIRLISDVLTCPVPLHSKALSSETFQFYEILERESEMVEMAMRLRNNIALP